MLKTSSEVAEKFATIFHDHQCSLFAGAGVSARAGLQVWDRYLLGLADKAEAYELLIAELMRKRIASGLLLEAASYFKSSAEIPDGEKLNIIAAPFKNYDPKPLLSLCSLPFSLAITTNYDRALHDAFGKNRETAPQCVERGDSTFKEALFWKDFYIARIHGRAEVPDSIVLDTNDYDQLYKDDEYQDFLRSLLVQHRFVFLGFSFLDPAIRRVLDFIRARRLFQHLHFAFVPENNEGLSEQMARYNIQVFTYDAANQHAVLWEGIREAALHHQNDLSTIAPPSTASFETAKRLLATCYARVSMGGEVRALRQLVVEGIIVSELENGVSDIDCLIGRLREYMALSEDEARILVDTAVASLVKKSVCMQDDKTIVIVSKQNARNSPVQVLCDGIVARLQLREKFDVTDEIRSALGNIVEEVIVLRGFDLGAEFSGASLKEEPDLFDTIGAAVDRHLDGYWQDRKRAIAEVFREMLRHPDNREETLLGELGRIAFGIEIVLQAGRSTMYALSLPQIVYLDASVLLPAIVPGHPHRLAYLNAIAKLAEAARTTGGTIVQVSDVFLEEVVNHRRKAVQIVKTGDLDDPKTLEKRMQFYGAEHVNVFIGAYSRWISDKNRRSAKFSTFLSKEAPYESVQQLKTFLAKQGFMVATTKPKNVTEEFKRSKFIRALDKGYESIEAKTDPREWKPNVLKQHEAAQLFAMQMELEAGHRSVLVTADTKLRKAVAQSEISTLKDCLISPKNLIQLVDLLVGIDVPPASLARLLWSLKVADDAAMLKDYLLSRALPTYNAALLLKMNDLLDDYVERAMKQAKLEKINLLATGNEERLKSSRFMDRVENEVFSELSKEVEKLERHIKDLEKKGDS